MLFNSRIYYVLLHYYNCFTAPWIFSGTTQVSLTRNIEPIWILLKQESEWQWYQLVHMYICTSPRHITTPAPDRLHSLLATQPTGSEHCRHRLCTNICEKNQIIICIWNWTR